MRKLKKLFHIHNCNKPIASLYWGFNTRKIIYECRCGKKETHVVTRAFSESFPIPTNYGWGHGNTQEFYDLMKI
jgi:hypothetical protein